MNADSASIAVQTSNLGKMYKLYNSRREKILDSLGLNRLCFWQKKQYQEFWALRGINLSIRKGERVGIIGHNGAGKSTLLKTLIGSQLPTEGTMRLDGRIQALMQLGIGFHPDFSGRENIRASLGYNNLSTREIAVCEEEIIDFTELEDFIDQPVKNYSAGMYARLAFATATAIKPEILIIDEVLGAGDAYFAGKCVERMKHLSIESGATVLFVSHDLASVQNMCERCIWIDRGLLRADGPALDVIKAYSAHVREREELRLKIRNEKRLETRKSVDVDYSVCWNFRLSVAEGAAISFPMRKLSFYYRGDLLAELSPGMPQDLDSSQAAFLYLNKNSKGWSAILGDGPASWHRRVDLSASRNAMGAFIVQADYRPEELSVSLEYLDTAVGEALFEYYNPTEDCYHLAHTLKLSGSEQMVRATFTLKAKETEQAGQSKAPVSQKADDEYGSGECRIKKVRFHSGGKDVFTLEMKSAVEIIFEYETRVQLTNPIFVFAAYLPSGQVAMQIWRELKELNGTGLLEAGRGSFHFKLAPLRLGAGYYIASAAIFKRYPKNGVEPEAYHLLDRKIEFQVISQEKEPIFSGVCVQEHTDALIPL